MLQGFLGITALFVFLWRVQKRNRRNQAFDVLKQRTLFAVGFFSWATLIVFFKRRNLE